MKKIFICPYCRATNEIDVVDVINNSCYVRDELYIDCKECEETLVISLKVNVEVYMSDEECDRMYKEFKGKEIKCPDCRAGKMHYYCGNSNRAFFKCSNYGGGCAGTMNIGKVREVFKDV